jgi:phospholipid/cholesterol/gamma-HCH transport system substrate-binding protein
VTVVAPRVGLVMNPDAKVKLHGVQVGKVDSIDLLPNGQAALHLAMDASKMSLIPDNVRVDIASTTAFGAKFVDLMTPPDPSTKPLASGAVLGAGHITVELNTVFQQLQTVFAKINPAKLNETLGALAAGSSGRGHALGQTISDVDHYLAAIDPSMPNIVHELQVFPNVVDAYADAAPDLLQTAASSTKASQTFVDRQDDLDRLLVSSIGLGDFGTQVLGDNRQPLTDMLHLLTSTTGLLSQYRTALGCFVNGLLAMTKVPPSPVPGALASTGLTLGVERYRYPGSLPKVAASGGPQCNGLPVVPPNARAPFVVADVGANPFQYGNQGILFNSDGLKQALFGPLDGPPRNSEQIGQPG